MYYMNNVCDLLNDKEKCKINNNQNSQVLAIQYLLNP